MHYWPDLFYRLNLHWFVKTLSFSLAGRIFHIILYVTYLILKHHLQVREAVFFTFAAVIIEDIGLIYIQVYLIRSWLLQLWIANVIKYFMFEQCLCVLPQIWIELEQLLKYFQDAWSRLRKFFCQLYPAFARLAVHGIFQDRFIIDEAHIVLVLITEDVEDESELIILADYTRSIFFLFCRRTWRKGETGVTGEKYPILFVHIFLFVLCCGCYHFWKDAASAPHVHCVVIFLWGQDYFWGSVPAGYHVVW